MVDVGCAGGYGRSGPGGGPQAVTAGDGGEVRND